MLKSQSNWEFTYNDNSNETNGLKQLNISPLTEKLLIQRGIQSVEQAKSFLDPKLDDLLAPSLLSDIDKSKARVLDAIEKGESILVFGDYDADGVSSTTVMVEALRELGAICEYYIPNRFTEGYGPNEKAFRDAQAQGYQVIITVDTGIAAIHEAEVAKELGIDLIITDHHEAQDQLPDAFAIIHPKCSENYPFKELAGVGVAFKFAEHLLGYFPVHLLDLVVIGTIADLVPLVEENRVLAHHGLKAITTSNRPGIKSLKKLCKIEGAVTEEDIGFLIGPRINAVGRLQDANVAVDLMLTDDPHEAEELANFISELNQERQKIVSDIAKEAELMVETSDSEHNQVLVVAKAGWNEGVLGIVASKLVRKFQKPAIVLSINEEKGHAKGSARSIDAFDLFSNCMEIRETFTHFGGHAQAAGMTLPLENVNVLREQLNLRAQQKLSSEDYKQLLKVDASVNIEELSLDLIKEIDKLSPFGMGNPKPYFHLKATPSELRQIGSQQNHLKITFQEGQAQIDSVGFGMGELYPVISPHSLVEAVGELQLNEWNGKKRVQILLRDLAVKEWQLFDHRGSKHWQKQVIPSLRTTSLAISFQNMDISLPEDVWHIQFNPQELKWLEQVTVTDLVLLDLPRTLKDLETVYAATKPERIFACYHVDDSQFFNAMPTREDFKWFYALLLKRKYFNLSVDTPKLMKHKGWKQDKIKFMIKVFHELEFVKMDKGNIVPNTDPIKKDLSESLSYQEKEQQSQIEETLYYSNYKELQEWFSLLMNKGVAPKEEVSIGL
ncbi:single-stranded-DNA-specific exonuclease RecJ [Aquibacillus kalidii]|uniref:single-stranded-DNA-specific exonuclease RecJ n=1 Tax=Aquibacillus kalidii TaxID=2762597 RepID=UPI00164702CE|nr:single-stranded-DNA-specific exonuclease RecJ [Aquibacillus kalidii]